MLIEKGEKTSRKEAKKNGKCNSLRLDIVFVCRDTNSGGTKELCRNHQLNVAIKLRQNKSLKEKFCRDKEFLCQDIIEEDCEENCRDNP